MSTTELKLQEPVQYGTELVDTLNFRKPTGKDLRRMPAKPDLDFLMNLAATLCGQPPSFFDMMGAADVFAAVEVVTDFLPGGQRTGDK